MFNNRSNGSENVKNLLPAPSSNISNNIVGRDIINVNYSVSVNSEQKKTKNESLQESKSIPPIIGNVIPECIIKKTLVSRDCLYNKIVEIFGKSLETTLALTTSSKVAGIYGLGGIGKTYTALDYFYHQESVKKYKHRIWIDAGSEKINEGYETLGTAVDAITSQDTKPMRIITKVKNWLQKNQGWLLVLDNVENYQAIEKFLPTGCQGHILITSRNANCWASCDEIPIDLMTETEAIALVKKIVGENNCDVDDAKKLVNKLGLLPLAVAQASSYIQASKCGTDIKKYLQLYENEENSKKLLANDSLQTTGISNHDPVAITWSMNFQAAEKQISISKQLLQFCSFLDSNKQPKELLMQAMEIGELDFNVCIGVLEDYSLIKSWKEFIDIHCLVQKVTQNNLSSETIKPLLLKLMFIFCSNTEYNREDKKVIKNLQFLLPHASSLCEYAKNFNITNEHLVFLYYKIGVYHLDYQQDAAIAVKSLDVAEDLSTKEQINQISKKLQIDIKYQLGCCYIWLKSYDKALKLINDSLSLYKEESPDSPFLYFRQQLKLVDIFIHKKRDDYKSAGKSRGSKKAQDNITKQLKLVQEILEEHKDKISYNDRAMYYHYYGNYCYSNGLGENNHANNIENKNSKKNEKQKQYIKEKIIEPKKTAAIDHFKEAKSYYLHALSIKKNNCTNNDSEIARTLHQLGSVCFMLKEFKDAKKYQEEALRIRKDFYCDQNHIDIANNFRLLGETWHYLKKEEGYLNKASDFLKESLKMFKSLDSNNKYKEKIETIQKLLDKVFEEQLEPKNQPKIEEYFMRQHKYNKVKNDAQKIVLLTSHKSIQNDDIDTIDLTQDSEDEDSLNNKTFNLTNLGGCMPTSLLVKQQIEKLQENFQLAVRGMNDSYNVKNEKFRNSMVDFLKEKEEEIKKIVEAVKSIKNEKEDQYKIENIKNNISSIKNALELKANLLKNQGNLSQNDLLNSQGILHDVLKNVFPQLPLYQPFVTGEIGEKEQALIYSQNMIENAIKDNDPAGKAFSKVLTDIQKKMEKSCYSCFISYAWPKDPENGSDKFIQSFLKILQKHLMSAGINATLDINSVIKGENIEEYMTKLPQNNHWLLIGTPSLAYKFDTGTNVRYEIDLESFRKSDENKNIFPMIPVLVSGVPLTSLPLKFHRRSMIDLTEKSYVAGLKELLFVLTRWTEEESYNGIWDPFVNNYIGYMSKLGPNVIKQLKEEEQKEKEKNNNKILEQQEEGIKKLNDKTKTKETEIKEKHSNKNCKIEINECKKNKKENVFLGKRNTNEKEKNDDDLNDKKLKKPKLKSSADNNILNISNVKAKENISTVILNSEKSINIEDSKSEKNINTLIMPFGNMDNNTSNFLSNSNFFSNSINEGENNKNALSKNGEDPKNCPT